MTETKTENGSNGSNSSLKSDIVRQVEHYFGDFNLPRDKFLLEQVKTNDGGWVQMETMLKFKRLSSLSDDGNVILEALKENSSLMEVDVEGKKVS